MNIIGLRYCKICCKQKPQASFYRVDDVQGSICGNCGDFHEQALLFFGRGIPPKGCQECGVTFAQLKWRARLEGEHVKTGMYLQPKDGVYQVLCESCSDAYQARSGMSKDTPWEHMRKLKGYK